MKILLLGAGGREHALAWKLTQSKHCSELYIAPGNTGTALCGTNLALAATDFDGIKKFSLDNSIDLIIIGPEEPLVKGIVDAFRNDPGVAHIPVIGPSKYAAQLEGSKAFAKQFMERHGVPTAAYREFDAGNYEEGIVYLRQHALPVVLKADGLAAGKGVLICATHEEAITAYEQMIKEDRFGEAGKKVVVEEFLSGIELSVFILTDGAEYVILPEAKDYKRIGEGDTGPNTGGMGAVSPVPFADAAFMKKVEKTIIQPTVAGLEKEKMDYTGFIFFGLIKVGEEPFVIEYNCRMGDPETEVVMPRLQNDLVELLLAAARGQLGGVLVGQDKRTACTVMAVSGGYPGAYEKGKEIEGLEKPLPDGALLFHAGTASKDGRVVTAGGRVLCATAYGASVPEAADRAKAALAGISFEGMYFRKDIGYEF